MRKDEGYFQAEPKGITDGSLCITIQAFTCLMAISSSHSKSSREKKFLLGLFRFFCAWFIMSSWCITYYARAITSAALPCVWITKRKRTKSKITTLIRGFYFSADGELRGLENNYRRLERSYTFVHIAYNYMLKWYISPLFLMRCFSLSNIHARLISMPRNNKEKWKAFG